MNERPIVVRQDCLKLAGDLVVGALLSQIVYWYLPTSKGKSKLGVTRNGVHWIAKTREEWMQECGLTLEQYKRAITVLKRNQLVEAKVMKFGGVTMSHLRLLRPVGGVVVSNPPTGWSKTHHPDGGFPTILNTETTTETTSIGSGATALHDGGDQTPMKTSGGKGEEQEQEKTMKAEDILKAHKGSTSGSLTAYWKSRCVTVLGGEYQKPLTGKEAGQLKQLSKYLGEQTRPVIDYAINHWMKFASLAGLAAGVSAPTTPNIGFLLKHHAVAVNLLTPSASPPVVEMPVSVQPVATAPHAEPEEVHTLSSQELTELLDSFKAP